MEQVKNAILPRQERQVILPTVGKYKYLIVLVVFLSMGTAALEGFSVGMLVPFLQNLSDDGSSGMFQTGIAWIDRHLLGIGAPRIERMYRICAVILIATWVRSILSYTSSLYSSILRARVLEDFRNRLADQLQALPLRYYSTSRTGELINSFTAEVGRTATAVGTMLNCIDRTILLVVYASLMIWISWQLSLLALVFFALLSLGLTRLISSVRDRGEEITRANGRFTSTISEFISGVRTVKAFNMEEFERSRLYKAASDLYHAVINTAKRRLIIGPFSQAVVTTVLIVVVVLAVQFFVFTGDLNMALLITFLFALFRVKPIVDNLNQLRGDWATNRAGLSNISDLLRRDNKPYLKNGKRTFTGVEDAIVFDNATFAYEPGKPVLKDINIRIENGKTTALVGASGAGKSTLVDLVPRFYDPDEGRILADGIDLREFDLNSLRQKMAVVSQETFIFNDTARANIAYGNLDASFEEIVEAAKKANALEFINEMSEGFDTTLGDRGVRLSGGQRQRIAIARALLRDPDILILDEATSALDSVSEKLVQESLKRLTENRTVVAIAHQLSTIENADWIVVLEEGRVVEQGPYDELLERKGQLWKYHSLQFQMA